LPFNGVQSVLSTGAFAPCIAVVATTPVDQGLRAFLTFDEYHRLGADHPRLVVQRTRVGRRHLAPLGVPRSELLAPSGRVVAVDTGDQAAVGREIVPLGGRRAEIIDQHLFPALPFRRHHDRTPGQRSRFLDHPGKVIPGIQAALTGDQIEDVAPFARCPVRPQPGLVTVQHHFQAATRVAEHVANRESFAPDFASCKQVPKHTF
jgi:hypothetical protein